MNDIISHRLYNIELILVHIEEHMARIAGAMTVIADKVCEGKEGPPPKEAEEDKK